MDRTLVLIILLVAVVANVVIIGLALYSSRRRRAAGRNDTMSPTAGILATAPTASAMRPLPVGPHPDEGAVEPSSLPSTAFASTPPIATVSAMTDRTASDSAIPSNASGRWILPPHEDPRAQTTIEALIAGESSAAEEESIGDALVDPLTGFGTMRAWEEMFRNEENRLARYRRPVTVLVAELDGLDALAERLGQGAADRLIPPVATAIGRNARSADVIARIGHARFVAILPETDEVAAINYVERVRTACDMWLEAGAVAVRLAIGWASPPAGGKLGDALRVADERMNADRRRQLRAAATPGAPTPVPATPETPAEASTPSAEDASPAAAPDRPLGAPAGETGSATTEIPPFPPRGPYPGSNGPHPNPISVIEGDEDRF